MVAKKSKPAEPAAVGVFRRFFHSEVAGSVVLLACTLAALYFANSSHSETYFEILHTKVGVSWGESAFKLTFHHWVNDFLMVLFFFVVGLEIKREIVAGQLSSIKDSALPVMAALGGMIVPALLYTLFNHGGNGADGWGIAMATDIAFALGILSLFGSRAPIGLKVFLTALAIADDIGAVMVIAVFYSEQIFWSGLAVAGFFMALLLIASRFMIGRPGIYILLALGVWAGVFASGVHATVAGILVALVVPVRARIDPQVFIDNMDDRLERLKQSDLTRQSMLSDTSQLDALDDLHWVSGSMRPAGITLEHFLHPIQAFFILPLFALCNAGVHIHGGVFKTMVNPISLGIILGLVIGKQLGVGSMVWAAVKLGWAELPKGVRWPHLYGAGCLAGVGFTMSLFISELAFTDDLLVDEAKIGILVASLISGVWGYLVLMVTLPKAEN
ncbi:MAG: Na+/H+ antiporter NhaA [Candidatus Omnitrophica bacterium]|nr:Na+/H+ antiporter NhaA [Candidatus Omnitrophota bacterium]